MGFLRRTRVDPLLEAITSVQVLITGNRFRPYCVWNPSAPSSPLQPFATSTLDIIQFDVTSAYLHGTLKKGVHMEQPEGYVAPGRKDWAKGLQKGRYGMVQTGRTWNVELNAHMESEGFMATTKDAAVYVKNF